MRFKIARTNNQPTLLIEDWSWWEDNEREIYNWMAEHMPIGIEHHQGAVLTFDTEKELMIFLVRWS